MRLTEVDISRFGVWRDLDIPLSGSGVSVFYGPNEAGKSTLMRFVRGVLYGFRPQADGSGTSGAAQGEIRIVHDGQSHTIRREAEPGQRGRARFDDLDWGAVSEARIRQVVRDTTESVYQNVFAIGLSELQELATLDADEVAEHIYRLSLGPEGERILRARGEFERQRRRLLTDDRKAGELVTLSLRLEEIDRSLADLGDLSHKHQHLRAEKDRLAAQIEAAQRRKADLEHDLRGYRFLDRVHGPWKRVTKLRGECQALPDAAGLPEDALARFDQIERDLNSQQARRDTLIKEADRLDDEADQSVGNSAQVQHECAIQRLSDCCDELGHRERRLHEKQSRVAALEQKLHARLGELGNGWSVERLTRTPPTAHGVSRLWDAARRYQTAVARRRGTVRRYKKCVSAAQKRQVEFQDRMKLLEGRSLAEAVRVAQQRQRDVRELTKLRSEELRLTAQAVAARSRVAIRSEIRELPPLFYELMWFVALAGIVLFFAGLWGASTNNVAGGDTAWIVGLIFACFGVFMAGASWTVKQHLDQYFKAPAAEGNEPVTSATVADRGDRTVGEQLAHVRQSIRNLVGPGEPVPAPRLIGGSDTGSETIDESDVLLRTAGRLADLQALQREERQIQDLRHRLSRYRQVLRDRQRIVSQRRREWCDTLRDLGIDETLHVGQVLQAWQTAGDAEHLRRAVALTQDDVDAEERSIENLRRQMSRLIADLPADAVEGPNADPRKVVSRWMNRPRKSDTGREPRVALRRQAREKRRDAESAEAMIRDQLVRRTTLLVQAGCATRAELANRLQGLARREDLIRQLDAAQSELRSIAESEPQLAIVEDDLLAFDAADNKRSIQRIEGELKQIDRDLQSEHQTLGRVTRELQELVGDRRAVSLQFEREQTASRLKHEMEIWCALDSSIDAVDHIRHRMERYGQSQTLQLASQYLDRLTCGKYPNIWSRLGERHLCIDDDAEQTLRVEQLSTGTREQVFLAIRLAMIRRFAGEGIELPMVLDDVFVNFDQIRTEAAVDTILDFAEQGHQILLFTCHLHLAHLFESKGVEPVWLPVNAAAVEKRRAG
ncbi:MAG: AAA family ATPase [Planctomycetaceae bacterium]|nr:AAA family ATPase [Planctomycetaceae bacterium]